jgi:hypothetical protein
MLAFRTQPIPSRHVYAIVNNKVCDSQLSQDYAKSDISRMRGSRMTDDAYGATVAKRRLARRNAANGGCVEIAANFEDVVAVRDSKRPEGGAHVVGRAAFAAFLADVKSGRYDPDVMFPAGWARWSRALAQEREGSAPPVSSRDG